MQLLPSFSRLLPGFLLSVATFLATPSHAADPVRLIVRADDMGAAQAVDTACIESFTNGVARSVEVIVPGPWFLHSVKLINQHPDLDVGVHLCLTSEWSDVKWRPLTHAPSLVDTNGYFHPMTSVRAGHPELTGFLQSGYKLDEVEAELRAQIERARAHLPGLTHLSAHMGTAVSSPELRALTMRLANEYDLPIAFGSLKGARAWRGSDTPLTERIESFVAMLESLEPGDHVFVEHPAHDSPEMRAVYHPGYENVAEDREAVRRVFTSPEVMAAVERLDIELIGYDALIEDR